MYDEFPIDHTKSCLISSSGNIIIPQNRVHGHSSYQRVLNITKTAKCVQRKKDKLDTPKNADKDRKTPPEKAKGGITSTSEMEQRNSNLTSDIKGASTKSNLDLIALAMMDSKRTC